MGERADTRVLLPVVAPASVAPLAGVAVDLAGPRGHVRALTAVAPGSGPDAVAAARAILDAVEQEVTTRARASPGSVRVSTEVVEATHPAVAVRDLAGDAVDVVVMGWQGSGDASSSFGRIIDEVVGRSRVPLVMARAGTAPPASLLVAFDTDQLHPAGRRGLVLAGAVASSLHAARGWPVTLLQTGLAPGEAEDLPDLPRTIVGLTDRIHHDPRRRHEAVEAVVDPTTMVVAPVAPTVAGLRSATTRLNWATGDATLVVAVDVGPVGPREPIGSTPLSSVTNPPREHRSRRLGRQGVALTIVSSDPVARRPVVTALAGAGEVGAVRTWWAGPDSRPHLSITVTVDDCTESDAIGAVMAVADVLPELVGTRVRYDLVDAPTPLRVHDLRPLGPLGELQEWD